MGQALEWHATHETDRTAMVFEDQSWTYGTLWNRSCRLATALHDRGLKPRDRIAILATNRPEYVEAYLAIALLGAAAVPMNFRYTPGEVDYVLGQSGARALITMPELLDPIQQLLATSFPEVQENLFVIGGGNGAGLDYEELLSEGRASVPDVVADPENCFFQGYTAGTTGFPKGCVNPHKGFVDFFKRTATQYRLTEEDRELVAAPLFHEAPTLFTLTQIFLGGMVVVTDDPSPTNLFRVIEKHRTTWTFLVPTMWQGLVDAASDSGDVRSMRVLVSAGQPLLTKTKEGLMEVFPDAGLNEFYGGTEVGIVTNLGPEDQRRKVRSVGRPVFGYHVRLLQEGVEVPDGETGEIYIRGPILLREYFENPEATAKAFREDWISLGDMGRFDEEGYLYIVDRKNDMIITGGENVFPNEIEATVHEHPSVDGAVVVGVPDERWGEAIKLVVVPGNPATFDPDELMDFCRQRLAAYKCPKSIDVVDELPMSSFGKILRREVRAHYWENSEVQV